MNGYLRDELAKEIFEDIKPSNPHGSQSDLYFGMPYCSYQTEQARKIADRILANFHLVAENPSFRRLTQDARNKVIASFNSPNRGFCTPGCPSGEHEHGFTETEDLILKLVAAVETLLPASRNPAQPVLDAIERVKAEIRNGHVASTTIDLDKLGKDSDDDEEDEPIWGRD